MKYQYDYAWNAHVGTREFWEDSAKGWQQEVKWYSRCPYDYEHDSYWGWTRKCQIPDDVKFLGETCTEKDQCSNGFVEGYVDTTCAATNEDGTDLKCVLDEESNAVSPYADTVGSTAMTTTAAAAAARACRAHSLRLSSLSSCSFSSSPPRTLPARPPAYSLRVCFRIQCSCFGMLWCTSDDCHGNMCVLSTMDMQKHCKYRDEEQIFTWYDSCSNCRASDDACQEFTDDSSFDNSAFDPVASGVAGIGAAGVVLIGARRRFKKKKTPLNEGEAEKQQEEDDVPAVEMVAGGGPRRSLSGSESNIV